MKSRSNPEILLGIGLPVYNGEKFIGQTIESLLNQTLTDFRLIICDNASTDRTEEICAGYAKADKRIKYIRNSANIGPSLNAAKVFQESQPTKYFALIGHDDLWASNFAEKLIKMLEDTPDASLAFSWFIYIDNIGKEVRKYDLGRMNKNFPEMIYQNRRQRISFQPSACFVHGIIRSNFFDTSLFTKRYGIYEDVFMLRALAGRGPFLVHPERLFMKRLHQNNYSSTQSHKKEQRKIECIVAAKELIKRLDLSFSETVNLVLSLLYFFKVKRFYIRNWTRAKKLLGAISK